MGRGGIAVILSARHLPTWRSICVFYNCVKLIKQFLRIISTTKGMVAAAISANPFAQYHKTNSNLYPVGKGPDNKTTI